MVDCSHGNSDKDYRRQPAVSDALAQQIEANQPYLVGAMLESHLVEGNQALKDPNKLVYGQSVTDACINWEATEPLLERLANAVLARRRSGKFQLRTV